ncbi:hypothetical protein [Novosphingobium resinovorum]
METTEELMTFVSGLLRQNHHYFKRYGPRSEIAASDPGSSAHAVWTARRLDTLLPNNRAILRALEVNAGLVPREMAEAVLLFTDHAKGYEQNQYGRLDHYQMFPEEFAQFVEKWAKYE